MMTMGHFATRQTTGVLPAEKGPPDYTKLSQCTHRRCLEASGSIAALEPPLVASAARPRQLRDQAVPGLWLTPREKTLTASPRPRRLMRGVAPPSQILGPESNPCNLVLA